MQPPPNDIAPLEPGGQRFTSLWQRFFIDLTRFVESVGTAPADGLYLVEGIADARLSAAQFLGGLATGILKVTTVTGVVSTAVAADFPAAAAGTLTGTTLAATVLNSSLTSIGTLSALTVSGTESVAELSLPSTGTAATIGQVTLVGGTKTVNTTAITATARLFFQRVSTGGTVGFASTYTQINGVSFTLNSDNPLDTSVYNWLLLDTH